MARRKEDTLKSLTKTIKGLTGLNKKEEQCGDRTKRIFFTILDVIILISFMLALYSVYIGNYTSTILFLVIGVLLLLFFIIRGILRDKKK